MVNILIVEDEPSIRKLIKILLTIEGYQIIEAENGESALKLMDDYQIDLAVVDIMMPKIDGYEFVDILRKNNVQLPIMMISAKNEVDAKKKGFNVGIDDYMVKPFDEEELVLRIKALLRRAQIATDGQITMGNMTVDYKSRLLTIDNQVVDLAQKEFLLLYKLLSYPNKVFTKFELLDDIWGYDCDSDSATVKVHIGRLRKKIETASDVKIVAVKGVGYKVVKDAK